jgi:hypothetical protein
MVNKMLGDTKARAKIKRRRAKLWRTYELIGVKVRYALWSVRHKEALASRNDAIKADVEALEEAKRTLKLLESKYRSIGNKLNDAH